MKVIILGSGSRGNATYIETANVKILIDAGLSGVQIKKRLLSHNRKLCDLNAILITHEHSDHIKGIIPVLKESQASLYLSPHSYDALDFELKQKLQNYQIINIYKNTNYVLGDLHFIPIPLSHDVDNIFGFLLKTEKSSLAYMTDTGTIDENYIPILRHMNMLIIEANHDTSLLACSNRPASLIRRIASKKGHLSNTKCAKYLSSIVGEKTKIVVLAHISEECNHPSIVQKTISEVIRFDHITLYMAKQDEASPLFDLEAS